MYNKITEILEEENEREEDQDIEDQVHLLHVERTSNLF